MTFICLPITKNIKKKKKEKYIETKNVTLMNYRIHFLFLPPSTLKQLALNRTISGHKVVSQPRICNKIHLVDVIQS